MKAEKNEVVEGSKMYCELLLSNKAAERYSAEVIELKGAFGSISSKG